MEHTCSYYCERPECIRAQRDELRDRLESAEAELAAVRGQLEEAQKHCDRLTGMKFSDRMHAALVDRAERAESALAAAKEGIAALMIKHGMATGHGDTCADLLRLLDRELAAAIATHHDDPVPGEKSLDNILKLSWRLADAYGLAVTATMSVTTWSKMSLCGATSPKSLRHANWCAWRRPRHPSG